MLLVLFFGVAYAADAHVPIIVVEESLSDIFTIEDPTLSQAFYGQLSGFPHTFQIVSEEPFHLFTQILQPDIESSANNISGIIIKEPKSSGRVLEITRLAAKDGEWESTYEPFGGDTYRNGPLFEKDLEAGTYRIEVHTPDNREKYVLVVGQREEMTIGYFELIRRMFQVKNFFEKSPFFIIQSVFVYVPILLIGISGLFFWSRHRRKKAV